jgi:hypothetical protein
MGIEEIKSIPINDYLSMQGIRASSPVNGKTRYKATWDRSDSEPSVVVYSHSNSWKDYGNTKGGSIIDLVMYIRKCSIFEAIEHLKSCNVTPSAYVRAVNEPEYKVVRVGGLSRQLRAYLEERQIPSWVYDEYCVQVNYSNKSGRELYAVGFKNDRGGYELRNRTHKSSISPKTITTIPGGKNVSVFEGFIDFLSCCVIYGRFPTNTVVVLNSTSNLAHVDWKLYNAAFLYLDNDKTGDHAAEIITELTDAKDMRSLYKDYNDLNLYLCHATFF